VLGFQRSVPGDADFPAEIEHIVLYVIERRADFAGHVLGEQQADRRIALVDVTERVDARRVLVDARAIAQACFAGVAGARRDRGEAVCQLWPGRGPRSSVSIIPAQPAGFRSTKEVDMAASIRKVDYFSMRVANCAGTGVGLLAALKAEGVNLLAFSGFPVRGGAQVDFIPENARKFRAAAKKAGLKLPRRRCPSSLAWPQIRHGRACAPALARGQDCPRTVLLRSGTTGSLKIMEFLANIDVDDLDKAKAVYRGAVGLRIDRRFGRFGVEMLGVGSPIYLLAKASGSIASSTIEQRRDYRRHWTSPAVPPA
jgi:hypothetical protein